MELLKKIWGIIVAVVAVLLGMFMLERSRRKDAESELERADNVKDNAVTQTKLDNLDTTLKEEEKKVEEEKSKPKTDEELLDFLKKV